MSNPYKRRAGTGKVSMRAQNNEQLQDNMYLRQQMSFERRRVVKMCDDCLHGHWTPCELDDCPCLCNDKQSTAITRRLVREHLAGAAVPK